MASATGSRSDGLKLIDDRRGRQVLARPDAATLKARARRGLQAIRDRGLRGFALARRALCPSGHGFSSLTRRIVVLNLDRPGHPRLGHPLSQPVPRRADRRQGAEPAHARRDHRPRHRRFRDGRHRRSQLDPEKLLELDQGQARRRRRRSASSLEFADRPRAGRADPAPLITPTRTRARIYDRDGALILDSATFYSRGECCATTCRRPTRRSRTFWTDSGRRR